MWWVVLNTDLSGLVIPKFLIFWGSWYQSHWHLYYLDCSMPRTAGAARMFTSWIDTWFQRVGNFARLSCDRITKYAFSLLTDWFLTKFIFTNRELLLHDLDRTNNTILLAYIQLVNVDFKTSQVLFDRRVLTNCNLFYTNHVHCWPRLSQSV